MRGRRQRHSSAVRAVAAAVAEIYRDGVSARKARKVAGKMGASRLSADQVGSTCRPLDGEASAPASRAFGGLGLPHPFLDAAYARRRRGDRLPRLPGRAPQAHPDQQRAGAHQPRDKAPLAGGAGAPERRGHDQAHGRRDGGAGRGLAVARRIVPDSLAKLDGLAPADESRERAIKVVQTAMGLADMGEGAA